MTKTSSGIPTNLVKIIVRICITEANPKTGPSLAATSKSTIDNGL
jgi:hypothetical protein